MELKLSSAAAQRCYENPMRGVENPTYAAVGRVFDNEYPRLYEEMYGHPWIQAPAKSEYGPLCRHLLINSWEKSAREHLYRSQRLKSGVHFNVACDGGPLVDGEWRVGEIKLVVNGIASFNTAQKYLIDLLRDSGHHFHLYGANLIDLGYSSLHDRFEQDSLVELLPIIDLTTVELEQYFTKSGTERFKLSLDTILHNVKIENNVYPDFF